MADMVTLTNITSVTQGATVYKGIRSISISVDKGRLHPLLDEGALYPSGAKLVGTPDFPVKTTMVFEQNQANMIALLAEAVGNLVIVLAGTSAETITIVNHEFTTDSGSLALQAAGSMSVSGVAFSADGTTLPISAA